MGTTSSTHINHRCTGNSSQHVAARCDSIAAARARGGGATAGLGAHSELSFSRDLSWELEHGLWRDVGNGSVLSLEDSSSADRRESHNKVSRICAGGGHADPKWGCKVPVVCGGVPSMQQPLSVRSPCSGALPRPYAECRRGGGPRWLHVDRHLPKTARRAGRVKNTPSAPSALTPCHRTGEHERPGAAHRGEDLTLRP